mmetsp:Transcript_64945/g.97911  ORF Transcript_64945/g.97911 Transcript_64945/m.97911 type:complete len:222 (+) Transcript_64945:2167-2832(+)
MKVRLGKVVVNVDILGRHLGIRRVETKEKRQEKARNDDIAQTQQTQLDLAILFVWNQSARKQDFDGTVKVLCHCDHDISPKYPENIVKEKTDEQDRSDLVGAQGKTFDSLQAKANAKYIVESPMPLLKIQSYNSNGHDQGADISHCNIKAQLERIRQDGIGDRMRNALLKAVSLFINRFGRKFSDQWGQSNGQGAATDHTKVTSNKQIHPFLAQKLERKVQ